MRNVKIWTSSLQMPLPITKSPGFITQNRTGQLVDTFCKLFLSAARSTASLISNSLVLQRWVTGERISLISLETMGYCREGSSCRVCVCVRARAHTHTHTLPSTAWASPLIRAVNMQHDWLILSPLLQPTRQGRWEWALKWLQGQPQGGKKDWWRTWNIHSLIASWKTEIWMHWFAKWELLFSSE